MEIFWFTKIWVSEIRVECALQNNFYLAAGNIYFYLVTFGAINSGKLCPYCIWHVYMLWVTKRCRQCNSIDMILCDHGQYIINRKFKYFSSLSICAFFSFKRTFHVFIYFVQKLIALKWKKKFVVFFSFWDFIILKINLIAAIFEYLLSYPIQMVYSKVLKNLTILN